jgi:hypothetical protein
MNINWIAFGIEAGSPVSRQTVMEVEQRLGVVFPEAYLDLVFFANEASPEISTFKVGGSLSTCVSEFFSLTPSATHCSVLWYSMAGIVPGLPEKMIPIAREAGGQLICLDFRQGCDGVALFDGLSHDVYSIANTFDAFVQLWEE